MVIRASNRERAASVNKFARTVTGFGMMAGLGVLLADLARPPKPVATGAATDAAAIHARATAAAVARITAESRAASPAHAVVAAPRPQTSVTVGSDRDGAPPGYGFVRHHGEMARSPLDARQAHDRSGPEWLDSPDALGALVRGAERAERDWTFGWIRLAATASPGGVAATLRRFGAEALGASGRLVRARLPGDRASLDRIAALDAIDGLGAMPADAKLPTGPMLRTHERTIPVFVTLMTDDPDGRWRHALEQMGAVVGFFDADIRAYPAIVESAALEVVAEADFVLAVEPVLAVQAAHDTAVPAMGADALRLWRSPGIFSGGGASVPIGVMDTGLNVGHLDISSNRASICGANFVAANRRLAEEDLWIDGNGHGTHVAGTILGNGYVEPRFAGMAPSVGHIRVAKVLDRDVGSGGTDSVVRGMDFLARATGCGDPAGSGERVRPLAVNMSLATTGRDFTGRSADVRKLDAVVWNRRQLYVVVQGNAGADAFANTSAAKNALSVGAVRDGGDLAVFSSHGPTADGRLAPQVVATGVDIRSPRGGGSRGDYQSASGTSSASPAVAGIAALLMDAVPAYREQPALTRARLMASAVRPDAWLDAPERFPADNTEGPGALNAGYGLGKASARTAVLDRDGSEGWTNGSATSELERGEYAHRDIVVPDGASRLDLVLTWDEPPADVVAAEVLNDLDLWLDRDGDCREAACGEHASVSRRDNVEWIMVRDPPAGIYRAKVLPRRIYTAAPRAALAWTVIRGASTPDLRLRADRQSLERGRHKLSLTLTVDSYMAAGTRLRVECRALAAADCGDVRLASIERTREDGVPDVASDWNLGTHLALGEVGVGETQEVRLVVDYGGEGAVQLYFAATAWNANAAVLPVTVGTAGPATPTAGPPSNDAFAAALDIDGAKGSVDVDLLAATTEPGEPPVARRTAGAGDSSGGDTSGSQARDAEPARGRPAASTWYAWTAPSDGEFRFGVGGPPDGEPVHVDVYRGDAIAALEPVESKPPEGGGFVVEAGTVYRVRVSNGTRRSSGFGRSVPVTLGWSSTERPANDDFALGASIEGPEDSIAGTNRGATLEAGESFGQFAATVWYRWTAPDDGGIRFDTTEGVVMAFTGARVDALRLVSQTPGPQAVFPVRAGQEYRIAVAVGSAYDAGTAFELAWRETDRADAGNDDFEGAQRIDGAASSSHHVDVDNTATVQPDEPPETGVRTKWWVWTAPADGRYTWRLADPSHAEVRVAAFSGETLDALRLVGWTGATVTSFEFSFAAAQDESYRISVGLPGDDIGAFYRDYPGEVLEWGPTPANDGTTGAPPLAGVSGSVAGSNTFATVEQGERVSGLGHSSVWWEYEAPADGWYRFRLDGRDLPFALAIYKLAADGSLDLLGASHRPGVYAATTEVVFRAAAGGRYRVRLGSVGDAPGGDFTMRWEKTAAPAWLRYVGRLADGGTDGAGGPVHLGRVSGLAFNGDGSVLYAASATGLHVLERDPATGDLTVAYTLAAEFDGMSLVWDARRGRLRAYDCFRQWTFLVDGRALVPERGDGGGAGSGVVCRGFMDAGGDSLYVFNRWGTLEVHGVDADGGLLHVETVTVPGLRNAAISRDDAHVYALTDLALVVFERHGGTGALDEAATLDLEPAGSSPGAIAISEDGQRLFVTESFSPENVAVFEIGDRPAEPRRVDTLPLSGAPAFPGASQRCGLAAARSGSAAIDLFCDGSAFGVQWNASSGHLVQTDFLTRVDRFGNVVPLFGPARSLAPSPDGRHAYVATEYGGILLFERVGNGDGPAAGTAAPATPAVRGDSPAPVSRSGYADP